MLYSVFAENVTGGLLLKIWTVDAQDANVIDDALFYQTSWIVDFLSADCTKFLLVATKGFGKTLLLRAKRERLQRQQPGTLLLPENAMVDKPLGFYRYSQRTIFAE